MTDPRDIARREHGFDNADRQPPTIMDGMTGFAINTADAVVRDESSADVAQAPKVMQQAYSDAMSFLEPSNMRQFFSPALRGCYDDAYAMGLRDRKPGAPHPHDVRADAQRNMLE